MASDNEEYLVDVIGDNPDKQIDALLARLDAVGEKIISINKLANSSNNDSGGSTLKDATESQRKYAESMKKVDDLAAQHARTMRELADATKFYNDWKAKSNGSTDKEIEGTGKVLKLKLDESTARAASATAIDKENRAQISALRLAEQVERQQIRATKAAAARTGEYDKLRMAYDRVAKAALNIGAAEGTQSERFKQLAAEANKLNSQLLELEKSVGRNQRNVGNYESATNGISKALTRFTGILRNSGNEIDSLARIFGFSKGAADDFRIALEHASKTLSGFFTVFDKASAKKGATEVVKDLTKAEAAYEVVIDTETAALNSNVLAQTAKISQERVYTVVKAQTTVATTAHTAVLTANAAATAGSTIALNANIASMHRNVAAYTVLNTESGVYRVVMAQSAVVTQANAAALGKAAGGQGALATATTASTVATRALSVALIATGLVALIAVLAILAVKYYEWQESIKETKLAQETLKKALDSTDYKKAIQDVSELRENVKLAKEGLLDKNAVVEQYNKTLGEATGKVSSLSEVEKALADKADAYVRMTLQKAAATEAYAAAADEAVKAQKSVQEIEDKNVGALDYAASILNPGTGLTPELLAAARNTDQGKKALKSQEQLLRIGDQFRKNQAQIAKDFGLDPLGNGNIQSGSIAALRKQISTLEEYIESQAGSHAQQIAAVKQLIDLKKQLKTLEASLKPSAEKGTVAALREEIKELEEKINAESEGSKLQQEDTKKLIALRERLKKVEGRESSQKKKPQGTAMQEYAGIKELNDARAGLAQQRVEQDMAANRLIFEDDQKSLEERLEAYKKFQADRAYAASLTRDKEVANAKAEKEAVDKALKDGTKRTPEQLAGLNARGEAANVKIQQATEKYQAEQGNITADAQKAITSIYESEANKRIQALQRISAAVAAEQKADMDALRAELEAGTITYAQYKAKEGVLAEGYRQVELNRQKSYLQQQIDSMKLSGGDTLKLQDQLNKAMADLYKADMDLFDKQQQEKANSIRALHDLQKQLGQETAQFLQALFSGQAQSQINELQKVIQGINEQKDAQLSALESTASFQMLKDEEKAAKKAEIEGKALADQKRIQAEQDKIRGRAAELNRAVAVAQILGETAQAEVSLQAKLAEAQAQAALLLTNPVTAAYAPVAAAAAASIAAQIPIVAGLAALKIGSLLVAPAYEEGTDFHPGGPAYMFEGNKLEFVKEPGKPGWIGSEEGLYNVARGATVTPLAKLGLPDTTEGFQNFLMQRMHSRMAMLPDELKALAEAQYIALNQKASNDAQQSAAIISELQGLQSTIKNKPNATFNFENLGMKTFFESGNSRSQHLNAYDR